MAERGGLNPIGITITAGHSERHDPARYQDWHVDKLLLVSRLQAALHERILQIDESLPETRTLLAELNDFRGVFRDTGYPRFGAREGAHDDLVLALAQGVWWASHDRHTVWVSSLIMR
jgi:hypothetical protein